MPLIDWTQKNSVGIVEIDNQHKHIFILVNRLYDALGDLNGYKEVTNVLSELIDYSKTHFKVEEDYFEKYNYKDKGEHIALHHVYNSKVAIFLAEKYNENSKRSLPVEVVTFLKDWWVYHINFEDKKYTETFHQHGLY